MKPLENLKGWIPASAGMTVGYGGLLFMGTAIEGIET
jgi:hypothetical protein